MTKKKILPILMVLILGCLGMEAVAQTGGHVEIERQLEKREPSFKAMGKLYVHSLYEYSRITQGSRKGNWQVETNRIAYPIWRLLPYFDFTVYERFDNNDYTFDFGSYYKFKNGYVHGGLGFGGDVDYIYKFKTFAEIEHRLYKNLFGNVSAKYLNYSPDDVYLLSPSLVYYFGDHYVSGGYGVTFTDSRGAAHYGTAKVNWALHERVHIWTGAAVGQRLYDIFERPATAQFGYIFFAGGDVRLYKGIFLKGGWSYSKESPSFIKRSFDVGLAVKF